MDVVPANNASQVAPATTIKITFSEPIDPNLAPGNFQLLRVDQGNFAETLIPLVIAENRRVALTVTPDLQANHLYELRVSGIRDTSGNVMAGTFTSRFYSIDTNPPQVSWVKPAEGQLLTAGDLISLEANATDDRGVGSVEFEIAGRKKKLTAAPWKAELRAPIMAASGPVELKVTVTDIFGNQTTATRTVVVEPRPAGGAPTIGATCPADGDLVVRGAQMAVSAPLADDQAIDSYELAIDGQVVQSVQQVDAATATLSYAWKPAATVAPGTVFQLRIAVRDFADQVTVREFTAQVPLAEPLKTHRPIPDNAEVLLGPGIFTWTSGQKTVTRLTLLYGAQLTAPDASLLVAGQELKLQCGATAALERLESSAVLVEAGAVLGAKPGKPLQLAVAGKVTVEPTGRIDVTAKGFAGGSPTGGAPAGITGSANAGGSHGGVGAQQGGTAGPVYDSITEPRLGGGGGNPVGYQQTSAGGGSLEIVAAELELGGELRARGEDVNGNRDATGAGGAVLLRLGTLSGGGTVDALGRYFPPAL